MLVVKSLHIIFIVTWFAALFYLPRLFVYHSMSDNTDLHSQFQVMERKLFWGISTPSAVLTLIFGTLLLFYVPAYFYQHWMWVKFGAVLLLGYYHIWSGYLMIKLRTNPGYRSHRWFRVFNEIPVLLLVAIIFLVELKPF